MKRSWFYILVTILAGLMGAATSSVGRAETLPSLDACPSDTTETRPLVVRFLTSPAYAVERQEHGIGVVDTTAIRALRVPTDSIACTTIDSTAAVVTTVSTSGGYFAAEGYYFIAARSANPRRISGSIPFVVLDSTFTLVGVFAM